MALQFSVAVRSGMADAIKTAIGNSAVLKLLTGPPPPDLVTADTGTVLVTMQLPATWLTSPNNGSKLLSGTWEDTSADATGLAGYFRIYASDGVTKHIQGTVTITGGGGDLVLDNPAIVVGQDVKITSFVLTVGNG